MLFLEFSMADHRKQKMEAWTREKPQEAQKEMGQQQLCPVPGFSPHGPGVVGEAGKPTSHVNDTQCTLPESEHIHSAARFLGERYTTSLLLQQVLGVRLLDGVLGKPRGSEVGCPALLPARLCYLPGCLLQPLKLCDLAATFWKMVTPGPTCHPGSCALPELCN